MKASTHNGWNRLYMQEINFHEMKFGDESPGLTIATVINDILELTAMKARESITNMLEEEQT